MTKALFFNKDGALQSENMRPQIEVKSVAMEYVEPDSHGYELVREAKVYRKGDRFIVTYWPDEITDPWHNCDDEGCGQDHVLGRFTKEALDDGTD